MSPEPLNGGEPWTDADVDRLARRYFSDPKPPIDVIAEALGRTTPSVFTELSRLGMAKRGAKLRACMPCTRQFYSSWIGERICGFCKNSEIMGCA
jgi:hypothetical protein